MKQLSTISRAFIILLTGLLMLTSVAGRSLTVPKKVKAASEQKSSQKNTEEPKTVIQELSLDAVVTPATSFDFSQDFYFLPPPVYLEIKSVSIPKRFETYYYFFSFFRNVFGHHIAINAP